MNAAIGRRAFSGFGDQGLQLLRQRGQITKEANAHLLFLQGIELTSQDLLKQGQC